MRNIILLILLPLLSTGCIIVNDTAQHKHHAHGCDHKQIVKYANGHRDHYCTDDYEVVIQIEVKYFYYDHHRKKCYIQKYQVGYINTSRVYTQHRRFYYDKYKRHFYVDKEPYLVN